jgi:hypothetical protein
MTDEPARRCHLHIRQATLFPCGACEDANTRWLDWKADEDAKKAEALKSLIYQRLLAITACALCDHDGYLNGALCRHDPAAPSRAQRGAALARASLTTTGGNK